MDNHNRLAAFVDLSADLTAFDEVSLYGTGVAEAYLAATDSVVGAKLTDALLGAYIKITLVSHGDAATRAASLRAEILGDEKLGPIARAILKLWYIGTWYALPERWQEIYGPTPTNNSFVVSQAGYAEGLLWPTIGAHPAGAKAPGFASWVNPPVFPPI
jgi:hypothetical protein